MKPLKRMPSDKTPLPKDLTPRWELSQHYIMQLTILFGSNMYVPVIYYLAEDKKRKMYGWLGYCNQGKLDLFLADPRDDEFGMRYDVTIDGKEYITEEQRKNGVKPYIHKWILIPKNKRKKKRHARTTKKGRAVPTREAENPDEIRG